MSAPAKTKAAPAPEQWPALFRGFVPAYFQAVSKLDLLRQREGELAAAAAVVEKEIAALPSAEEMVKATAAARIDGKPVPAPAKKKKGRPFGKWWMLGSQRDEPKPEPIEPDELRRSLLVARQEIAVCREMVRLQAAVVDKACAEAPANLRAATDTEMRLLRGMVVNTLSLVLPDLSRMWIFSRNLQSVGIRSPVVCESLGDPNDNDSPIARAVEALRRSGYKI